MATVKDKSGLSTYCVSLPSSTKNTYSAAFKMGMNENLNQVLWLCYQIFIFELAAGYFMAYEGYNTAHLHFTHKQSYVCIMQTAVLSIFTCHELARSYLCQSTFVLGRGQVTGLVKHASASSRSN